MVVSIFDKNKNYKEIETWCELRKLTPIPKESFPEPGFIVHNDDKNIVCAWLFKMDNNISTLECFISNPDSDRQERDNAIHLLLNYAMLYAKELKYKYMYIKSDNERLIEKLEANNFIKGEKNLTHLIRSL